MQHAFLRMEMLVGTQALKKLSESKVAVFGIGGVGSFAAEGLARCGIGKLVLVDKDCIDITNINRQIHATTKTIGMPKVEVMKNRILEINPKAIVDTHQIFFLSASSHGIIDNTIDYIVDAVDTVTAKINLAVIAKEKGIPIISSMGAGNKMNPAMLEVADISKTTVDPLARVMRKELRERGITSLKVVYSKEKPLPANQEICVEQNEDEHDIYAGNGGNDGNSFCSSSTEKENVRRRKVQGSVSFVPPVAGFIIAGEVVRDLISAAGDKNV
jgi:tRNA A37 threonylcarbamoyladenosine dehydratase